MTTYNLRDQNGLTLMELLVAVSLFTVVVLAATAIFARAIDNQQKIVSTKNIQEGLDHAFTIMAAEIRGGQNAKGCGECSGDVFFCTAESTVTLKNAAGQCVTYTLDDSSDRGNSRITVTRDETTAFLTPDSFDVVTLNFDAASNFSDPVYPAGKLTIYAKAQTMSSAPTQETIEMQTTSAPWLGN